MPTFNMEGFAVPFEKLAHHRITTCVCFFDMTADNEDEILYRMGLNSLTAATGAYLRQFFLSSIAD
jgi:hypothetical protein